jgi:hypothetical protein
MDKTIDKDMVATVKIGERIFRLPCLNLLPALTVEEREGLRGDIKRVGVLDDVVVNQDDEVADGANRLVLCFEEGITLDKIPIKVIHTEGWKELRDYCLRVKAFRRQLTTAQRRDIVDQLLRDDPEQSDRSIAGKVGVDHKVVGRRRDKLEAGGALPHVVSIEGQDGKTYPSKPKKPRAPRKPKPPPKPPKTPPPTKRELGRLKRLKSNEKVNGLIKTLIGLAADVNQLDELTVLEVDLDENNGTRDIIRRCLVTLSDKFGEIHDAITPTPTKPRDADVKLNVVTEDGQADQGGTS